MKKLFPGHKVVTLDDLKEGGAEEQSSSRSLPFRSAKLHEEPMKIYCFDCSCLICRDCTISDSTRSHNHEVRQEIAAPEMKKKLIQHLDPLKEVKSGSVPCCGGDTDTTKSEVEAQGACLWLMTPSNKSFHELCRRLLIRREQELLKESCNEE